jgi:hypothetical protein
MAEFNPATAIALLQRDKDTLWPDANTRDAFLNEALARLGGRSTDDRKEATKLAVETAKMLLTVAVAVLVATGTLLQFARTNGVSWGSMTIFLFCATVILLFVSMAVGFSAISSVYKRADGVASANAPAWSTEPLSRRLNIQSSTGVAALLGLLGGLFFWAWSDQPSLAAINLSIPAGPQSTLASGPVTIEGSWSELRLKTAGNQEIKLPASSSSTSPLTITCR